jgi:hypothetical protein
MITIAFCVDCKQIVDDNWSNRCPSPTSTVDGFKGGLHWYQAFNSDKIPQDAEYDFLRDWIRNHGKTIQQALF